MKNMSGRSNRFTELGAMACQNLMKTGKCRDFHCFCPNINDFQVKNVSEIEMFSYFFHIDISVAGVYPPGSGIVLEVFILLC